MTEIALFHHRRRLSNVHELVVAAALVRSPWRIRRLHPGQVYS